IEVRVTRLRRDTTLAKIIHLVERAQAQRAPSQALVERFARVYTPAVIVLAAARALVPPLLVNGSARLAGAGLADRGIWPAWFYPGVLPLGVACPRSPRGSP